MRIEIVRLGTVDAEQIGIIPIIQFFDNKAEAVKWLESQNYNKSQQGMWKKDDENVMAKLEIAKNGLAKIIGGVPFKKFNHLKDAENWLKQEGYQLFESGKDWYERVT